MYLRRSKEKGTGETVSCCPEQEDPKGCGGAAGFQGKGRQAESLAHFRGREERQEGFRNQRGQKGPWGLTREQPLGRPHGEADREARSLGSRLVTTPSPPHKSCTSVIPTWWKGSEVEDFRELPDVFLEG